MTLKLWDVVNGVHLKTLKEHTTAICSVAFTPDGLHVVSGYEDNILMLWDVISGNVIDLVKADWTSASVAALSITSTHPSFSPQFTSGGGTSDILFGYITDDGWVYSISHGLEKVFWIPTSYRLNALAVHGTHVALATSGGQVVILDTKHLNMYFKDI
jgi:WD40 repeat protein